MAASNQDQSNAAAMKIVQEAWATQVDARASQQMTALAQVRQAKVNLLTREVAALTKKYGAQDTRVMEARASLGVNQTLAARLAAARDLASTTMPAVPQNGWVLAGRVRHADLSAAAGFTVFLVDQKKSWQDAYGYSYTDASGYFSLTYTPPATDKKSAAAAALSAYVQVSNASRQAVYLDADAMTLTPGQSLYCEIVLNGDAPLGTPPSASKKGGPPAQSKK